MIWILPCENALSCGGLVRAGQWVPRGLACCHSGAPAHQGGAGRSSKQMRLSGNGVCTSMH